MTKRRIVFLTIVFLVLISVLFLIPSLTFISLANIDGYSIDKDSVYMNGKEAKYVFSKSNKNIFIVFSAARLFKVNNPSVNYTLRSQETDYSFPMNKVAATLPVIKINTVTIKADYPVGDLDMKLTVYKKRPSGESIEVKPDSAGIYHFRVMDTVVLKPVSVKDGKEAEIPNDKTSLFISNPNSIFYSNDNTAREFLIIKDGAADLLISSLGYGRPVTSLNPDNVTGQRYNIRVSASYREQQ